MDQDTPYPVHEGQCETCGLKWKVVGDGEVLDAEVHFILDRKVMKTNYPCMDCATTFARGQSFK